MRGHSILFAAICWMLFIFNVPATVFYVDVNSTNPVPPYAGWNIAATNIQDAVDAATNGDLILVTNGVYQTGGRKMSSADITNRVVLTNSIIVRSVNGPGVTMIAGTRIPGTVASTSAVRCAFVGAGSVLSGFTLTNGEAGTGNYVNGGGVSGTASGVVSNCVITGNVSGGAGGGALQVSLINCVLAGNYGVGAAANSALQNCVVTNNLGPWAAGLYGCKATNCLVAFNRATNYGGGTAFSTLVSCTVTANSLAPGHNGNGGGSYSDSLFGCIVYDNSAPNGSNYYSSGMTFSCSAPLPGGTGNISNPPLFVNSAPADFHLSANSPCINSGSNGYVTAATDLEGNPRIIGGMVDMGAYEFKSQLHYVDVNGTNPVSPYASWAAASTDIQSAIDASSDGDLILVSNGLYNTGGRMVYTELVNVNDQWVVLGVTNRVAVNKAVTVESVNGPAVTVIQGYQVPGTTNDYGAVRCVYLTNNAMLIGFTLTNGATWNSGDWNIQESGGGIWCESSSSVVSNCVVAGNSANGNGGGVYQGMLIKCKLFGNSASDGGGGGYCTLKNCTLSGNMAPVGGGAVQSALTNCVLVGNTNSFGYGPAGFQIRGAGAADSTLVNCMVAGNNSTYGNGGGVDDCSLNNCTIVGNSAAGFGGGVSDGSILTNCIVYDNTAPDGPNFLDGDYGMIMSYCCTTPMPSDSNDGGGNITNDPLFVNLAAGDYHLQTNSPCINSGDNDCISTMNDLDGNPRIVVGTVDIGAYEFQSPVSQISYAWLYQYGLPINANTDSSDADGDGMSNFAEWKAGTIPTDATSVLKLSSPSNSVSGITVTWQSVSGVIYYLQVSTNLSAQPPFTTIQSNIAGQVGTTSYTDTTATNGGSYFYRVGVQLQ